jgi:hypothetical protein
VVTDVIAATPDVIVAALATDATAAKDVIVAAADMDAIAAKGAIVAGGVIVAILDGTATTNILNQVHRLRASTEASVGRAGLASSPHELLA